MAFYITDEHYEQRYDLVAKKGIATLPEQDLVKAGGGLRFTLEFGRIPLRRFHLYEGTFRGSDVVRWNFTGIRLP